MIFYWKETFKIFLLCKNAKHIKLENYLGKNKVKVLSGNSHSSEQYSFGKQLRVDKSIFSLYIFAVLEQIWLFRFHTQPKDDENMK